MRLGYVMITLLPTVCYCSSKHSFAKNDWKKSAKVCPEPNQVISDLSIRSCGLPYFTFYCFTHNSAQTIALVANNLNYAWTSSLKLRLLWLLLCTSQPPQGKEIARHQPWLAAALMSSRCFMRMKVREVLPVQ